MPKTLFAILGLVLAAGPAPAATPAAPKAVLKSASGTVVKRDRFAEDFTLQRKDGSTLLIQYHPAAGVVVRTTRDGKASTPDAVEVGDTVTVDYADTAGRLSARTIVAHAARKPAVKATPKGRR